MRQKRIFLGLGCFFFFLMAFPTANAQEVIYNYGFEQGLDGWMMDNAIWELCLPESGDPGPQVAHGGYLCVGTVCEGNYPAYADSRLISPEIELPGTSGDEEIHLRFWHWFSYSSYDYGYVQVSVQDEGTGEWSPWETVPNAVTIASVCNFWCLRDVELTAYAGQTIKIGFYHTAGRNSWGDPSESTGWYIDDIEVIKKVPVFTGDFEDGWADWTANDDIWEVGTSSAGPPTPHGGSQCAGTVLDGNYQGYRDSRLISPFKRLVAVSGNEEIHLRFWHWFSYSSYDAGYVQISIQDEGTGEWSPWETISTNIIQTSGVWTPTDIDLTAYADRKVRIAFYHTAGRNSWGDPSESTGWYVDDIAVITKDPEPTFDFECGWNDWSADNGIWEVGEPTSGPETAFSGFQCAATVLDGKYKGYTDSHLISPSISLPECEDLKLTFQHWYSYSSYDAGYVQISILDEATGIWSAWADISGPFGGTSAVWSAPLPVDLTPYAGNKVRIAFYHTAGRNSWGDPSESTGWYIDHIRIYCDSDSCFPHFCECDLNHDGCCNILDWPFFIEDWGRTDCNDPGVECECDLNHDGCCNILDWPRFIEDWGKSDCLSCSE